MPDSLVIGQHDRLSVYDLCMMNFLFRIKFYSGSSCGGCVASDGDGSNGDGASGGSCSIEGKAKRFESVSHLGVLSADVQRSNSMPESGDTPI